MIDNNKEYDILLSFAGEDRVYVEQVAQALKRNGVEYFYDKDKEIEMWGNDLPQYLQQVYSTGIAKHCVIFISEAYNKKYFPQYELRSALVQELAQQDYILPVFMEKEAGLPVGVLPTKMYIIAPKNPNELADAIVEKLGKKTISNKGRSDGGEMPASIHMPRVPKPDFDVYEETEKATSKIYDLLSGFSNQANQNGNVKFIVLNRGGKIIFRAQSAGEVLYYLDVWVGDIWGDNTICFYSGWGRPVASNNSTNAMAEVFWDTKKERPMLKLQNFSLLDMNIGNSDSISVEELVNKIWDTAVDAVEKQFDKN